MPTTRTISARIASPMALMPLASWPEPKQSDSDQSSDRPRACDRPSAQKSLDARLGSPQAYCMECAGAAHTLARLRCVQRTLPCTRVVSCLLCTAYMSSTMRQAFALCNSLNSFAKVVDDAIR
jgi:hypothetical protein